MEVLDLMHALGYLWEAAGLFHPRGAQSPGAESVKQPRLVFVKQQAERLLNGQVQTVIRSLRAQSHRLSAAQRESLAEIIGYLSHHAARMQYDHYRQAGYPIASGVIEGTCRHVVCDRMERSGMRWVMPGAKAMLALRCIGINQDWEAFMKFHIEHENQRLYPVRAANDETFLPERLIA